MAPMTRSKSPRGVPGPDVASYYRRRDEGGVGLIITEGTYVPHPAAGFYPDVPHFYGKGSLLGWKRVAEEIHLAGGKIFPQLWHVGLTPAMDGTFRSGAMSPSGLAKRGEKIAEPMTQQDIDNVVRAFGEAAQSAQRLGSMVWRFTVHTVTFWTSSSGMEPTSVPMVMEAICPLALVSQSK